MIFARLSCLTLDGDSMIVVLNKTIYIFAILLVNLYICSVINNKLISKIDLKRGYKGTRSGGAAYPFVSVIKYMSKGNGLTLWDVFIFLNIFILWSVTPINANLVIVDLDYSLLAAFVFFIILMMLKAITFSYSANGLLYTSLIRRAANILSFILPIGLSLLSIVFLNKTLNLRNIVNFQYQYWNVVYQPLGFIVCFFSIVIIYRLFVLTDKDTMIINHSGYREGMGLSKLVNDLSNYMSLFFLATIVNIAYLGGWQDFMAINGNIMLAIKFYAIIIAVIIFSRSFSMVNDYKRIVSFNYKFLVPLAIINFIISLAFIILRNLYNLI